MSTIKRKAKEKEIVAIIFNETTRGDLSGAVEEESSRAVGWQWKPPDDWPQTSLLKKIATFSALIPSSSFCRVHSVDISSTSEQQLTTEDDEEEDDDDESGPALDISTLYNWCLSHTLSLVYLLMHRNNATNRVTERERGDKQNRAHLVRTMK